MTLKQIAELNRDYLSVSEAASILQCDPQGLRVWLRECPEKVGIEAIILPHRIRIPKVPFLKKFGYEA